MPPSWYLPSLPHLPHLTPPQPGVFTIPYPYWHQHALPPSTPTSTLASNSLYQLELLLAQQTAPSDTAAIIIEPVLGEGGYVAAPAEFLDGLRRVCDAHGMLLIVDEVQSGFGRTGKYFATEYSGVRPDILVIAKVRGLWRGRVRLTERILKGLANGFPLSGVISRKELTDTLKPGSMVCIPPYPLLIHLIHCCRVGRMPETPCPAWLLPLLSTLCGKKRSWITSKFGTPTMHYLPITLPSLIQRWT